MTQPQPMVPFMFPWQMPQQSVPPPFNEVPARVRVAICFLQDLSYKTMTQGVVHPMGCETIDGQKLTPQESRAQGAALSMLHDYFNGQLEPSGWEMYMIKRPNALTIRCEECQGTGFHKENNQAPCPTCNGRGILIVTDK